MCYFVAIRLRSTLTKKHKVGVMSISNFSSIEGILNEILIIYMCIIDNTNTLISIKLHQIIKVKFYMAPVTIIYTFFWWHNCASNKIPFNQCSRNLIREIRAIRSEE